MTHFIQSGKLARLLLVLFLTYLGLTLIWFGPDSIQSTAEVIGLR